MLNNFTPDALIFDIDGVLLNVENSFPEVIRTAINECWESMCGGCADSGASMMTDNLRSPGSTAAWTRPSARDGLRPADSSMGRITAAVT